MTSAHPFTLAEFGELVCAALEDVEGRNYPEASATLPPASSRRSFLSFSPPESRHSRPGLATPSRARTSLSHPPKSFFSLPQNNNRMLHHPTPLHPIDAMSHLDLSQTCIPTCPTTPTPSASRPRARQVFDKIRRQASALVKSPTKRSRSHSCTQTISPKRTDNLPLLVPTVTFASATSIHSSTGRARSVSCSCSGDDDARSMATSILHIDGPSGGDFVPYLPLVTRLERGPTAAYATDVIGFSTFASRITPASIPLPISDASVKRPVIPPASPSPSRRSDSTASTKSPVTPVFPLYNHHDIHPYASVAAMSQRWSLGSDDAEQNADPFAKGKVRAVRRSLIQDSFLLACAAVDDSPTSAPGDDGTGGRSSGRRGSVFKKKSAISLPPSKPPPSCPLPSPPQSVTSGDSDCARSSLGDSSDSRPSPDEEWTLFLGGRSKLFELPRALEPSKKEIARGRSGSSPSAPSSKPYLSPLDIPPQFQQEQCPRARTVSNLSTRSSATGRRIESGPAPNLLSGPNANNGESFEDWTLSLPVLRKPKSSLCIDSSARVEEAPVDPKARKCKSFAEWTTTLSDEYEREQNRLREKERDRERERKTSRVSLHSVSSARVSQRSIKRLPIGPAPSHSPIPGMGNAGMSSLNLTASKSTVSLRSCSSSASISSASTAASYRDTLPFSTFSPTSPAGPNNNSSFTLPSTMRSVSASTSVSTLAKFPLPPSFSSKLMQRRQGAPPLPKPLLSISSFKSTPASSLSATASTTVYGKPRDLVSSLGQDEDSSNAASAPAATSCFSLSSFPPSSSSICAPPRLRTVSERKERKRPEMCYLPPSTTSSASSVGTSTSTLSKSSSIKTVSSTSTIVPNRVRTRRLMERVGELEPASATRSRESLAIEHLNVEDIGARSGRSSFESSIRDTEYDTCPEGSFLDVDSESCSVREEDEIGSMVSGAYYSARSSMSA
ncbi:hypothetical protein P691DRAFT_157031 [Macrolepiota fuliginosa MF-IS2]|uniref:Uncharacterized protein n=1 Tax=Macrolepiota fuliginosa MF-IS2 TaxID=1400762 RepID=A0A9P6C2V9_9AGAR|nr:hypothetical protein P691DRAFT_157031 [Macrolepiota fuliginosa MF-IS2]